ncbi:MAG: hypothetical protein V1781_04900 [Bacteroidota bacterium]
MKKLFQVIFFFIFPFIISNQQIVSANDSNTIFPVDSTKHKYDKKKFRELFTQANLMMLEGFNDTAFKTFFILHKWDPANANINFKIGQLYLLSSFEKSKAVDFLEKAAPKATRRYIPDEPKEKRCPKLVYFLLGQAYHLAYRFDEAIAMYEKFKKEVNFGDLATAREIIRRIEISNTAKQLVNAPVKCTITNLGDSVNSEFPDYGAVITADESEMYFTSRRFNAETGGNDNLTIDDKFYEDTWVTVKKGDGSWSKSKPVSTHINSWYNEAVLSISPDGQQMLVYKNDKGGSIWFSRFENNQWSYAYMLGTEPGDITDINSNYWEPSACFSPDGNTLYFVSNRPGGVGGRDIYKCVKLPTGRWGRAINLGPTVNTIYDEDAPFMHPDGVTMFFSSNGHKSMGGFDIFFTMQTDSGWMSPQNIGYPINTTDDDIFYVMSTDGKRAYFSSVRPEGKGEKDIYMITSPTRIVIPVTLLKGYVSFNGVKENISFVTITATDLEIGTMTQEIHPNSRTLKYILPLNPGKTGKTYSIKYEADNYRPFIETVSVSPVGEYREIDKNFDFKPLGTISIYGKITTPSGKPISIVKITVKNIKNDKTVGIFKPNDDGTYSFDVEGKGGEHYLISFESNDYLPVSETIELPEVLTEYDFRKDVFLETSKTH